MENTQQLKKSIGLFTATTIAIGITVGSGIFVKPALVLSQSGSSGMALAAWLLGGMMAITGGLTVAEVAARIPKTGGIYIYIEELYGAMPGFLSGWVQTFIYGPGLIGALALYFSILFKPVAGYEEGQVKAVAVGAVLFLMTMNLLATKFGGFIQNITTVGKMIPIYLIFIFGISAGNQNIFSTIATMPGQVSFGAAVLSCLWAYDGWILVGNVAGEMENSQRNLPRAILIGLSIVIIGYLGMNTALFHVLSAPQVIEAGKQAPAHAAELIFGTWGGKLIGIGILISIFGCLNGTILSSPRIPYAMATRGDIKGVHWLTRVHPKFNTPINAIIMQSFVGIIMILLANPDAITDLAIFSVYVFYTMAFAGLFLLRKKDTSYNGYKTPLFPIVPILAIVSSLYIIGNTILSQPKLAAVSAAITLAGVPVFLFFKKKNV